MVLNGRGALQIGSGAGRGSYWGVWGGLDVSFGGVPASIMIGADPNKTTRTDGVEKHADIAMPNVKVDSAPPVLLLNAHGFGNTTQLMLGGSPDFATAVTDIYLSTATDPSTPISSSDSNTGGTRLYINRTGQVGIGTTSPAAQLHVADSMQVDGTATFNGVVHVQPQGDISMGDFAN